MYRPRIGLEVHAELLTRTKMFCESANEPDETRPNVHVCPICLAHPGTLPVINKDAIQHIVRVGVAIGGKIASFSEFDRKSYFYPDIPKGYQISQYAHPLVMGGSLAGVAITRVHLEEDTARSVHTKKESLVDFNRAGIPLMELVTEPVIPDAQTAGRFSRELQLLLRTLRASGANLEKGEMRIEANVSLSDENNGLGTKVEIKNLNSFRSVERAITSEIQRQTKVLERGEKVAQETRGWNETKQTTFHQRFKEESADYRYFPEPDLPKLVPFEIQEYLHNAISLTLPELPWEKRERLIKEGATPEAAEILVSNPAYEAVYLHQDFGADPDPKVRSSVISMLTTEIRGKAPDFAQLEHLKADSALAKTMALYVKGSLSSTSAKVVIGELLEHGGNPEAIVQSKGLRQEHDLKTLESIIDTVLATESKAVAEYRSGKHSALQYLIGKAMKESGGAGNPIELKKLITKILR